MPITTRLKRAWNAFFNKDPTRYEYSTGQVTTYRPDRVRLTRGNERSIVTSVFNRIAIDIAAIDIKHVRLDENGRYLEEIDSALNNCLTLSSNRDQTAQAFKMDMIMSLFDEGSIAVVPTDTTDDPRITGSYDIETMRVGKIIDWRPEHVKVRLYNENTGLYEEIVLPKSAVAIIENPLYSVMNEPNSTLQRLIRKLNLLDVIDEQSGAGKLDLIIQFPFAIRTDAQRERADQRRKELERQLAGSKYGIAYTDGTEHVTQLNRAVENNLMSQIEYLTNMLYSQLGMSQTIFDGTADEQTMLNYYNRTVEPILSAITIEMNRKFLTKTARTQFQAIKFFRDPFRLVPTAQLAELADKFTRNEIMSSNELRQVIGMKPADDPHADELRNSNLSHPDEKLEVEAQAKAMAESGELQNDPELEHSGVKGQKWGVRRYQNYDGSFTPLGREHYGVGESRSSSLRKKQQSVKKALNKVPKELREDYVAKNVRQVELSIESDKKESEYRHGLCTDAEREKAARAWLDAADSEEAALDRVVNASKKKLDTPIALSRDDYRETIRDLMNPTGLSEKLEDVVFVSGSSKTQDKESGYYRESLNKSITDELDNAIDNGKKIIVGDAPGIDRQVQDYLASKNYDNVEIYGPGKDAVRYIADDKWKTNLVDDPEHEPGSPEWLAKKDVAMTEASTEGLAVILDQGAKATRKNVKRLLDSGKMAKVFELSADGPEADRWVERAEDIIDALGSK